jgi:integrase
VSNKLLNMIANLKNKYKTENPDRIFAKNLRNIRRVFSRQRLRISSKLQNPRLLKIHFHTIRHWKATTLYHETRDIYYVMQFLGHKNIKNTMKYVQLEEALFKKNDDGFICKVACDVEEARKLIELGFGYVCEFDGAKLFKIRK